MQPELKDLLCIIYGGGAFGVSAMKALHPKYHLIVIDTDPNCEIGQKFPHSTLSEIFSRLSEMVMEEPTSEDDSLPPANSVYFMVGGIQELETILRVYLPKYFIPVAPIHVMKELFKSIMKKTHPNCNFSPVKPRIEQELPENLNDFSYSDSLYLSYAKWDEICPDNCPAPLDYCPFHKKVKPIPVSKFIQLEFSESLSILYESLQLSAGLGGIEGSIIFAPYGVIEQAIQKLQDHDSIILTIATGCRCHGVIDGLKIEKRHKSI